MAEATTADVFEVQEKTLKKVTLVANILNKNLVPASQQKERDAEANAWKSKLFGFLSGIKDTLKDLARPMALAKIPWKLIIGAIAFLVGFFTRIAAMLGKLKNVLTAIANIPKAIIGFFTAIRTALTTAKAAVAARIAAALKAFLEHKAIRLIGEGLKDLRKAFAMAREGIVLRIANALKAFKEHRVIQAIGGVFARMRMLLNAGRLHVIGLLKNALVVFKEGAIKSIGSVFVRMRMLLNAGKLHVIGLLKGALAVFKENAVVKAIGSAFVRMRMLLNAAKLHVIGVFAGAKAVFMESPVVKALGSVFKTIGGLFGSAIGVGKGAGATAKTGGVLGAVKGALATFKAGPLFVAIGGIAKILTGAFQGVLALIGGVGKVAGPMVKVAAGAGKGIIGILSFAKNVIAPIMKPFAGILKGVGSMVKGIMWPLMIIIGVFDFIKGFRKDKNWEGEDATLFDKIGMGIEEALVGLVGLPLDMIKNAIAWILGKFGVGKTKDPVTGEEIDSAWMVAMKEFSFSDLIRSIWQGMWNALDAAIKWITDLFADPVGTLKELGKDVLAIFADFGKWLWDNSIGKAIGWVQSLFGWGKEDEDKALTTDGEKFSLLGMISTAMDAIFGFFKEIFDIDWGATFTKLIGAVPGGQKIMDFFGIGEASPEKQRKVLNEKIAEITEAQGDTQGEVVSSQEKLKELAADLAFEKDKLARSLAGENMYVGGEGWGQDRGRGAIAKIEADMQKENISIESGQQEMKRQSQLLNESQIALTKIAKAGVDEEQSLAVYDRHLEKLLLPLPAQMGALLKAYGVGQVGRQGMTVNNVTVAPQTSTSVASTNIAENVYGTVDPYTNAAGAYG